MRVMSAGDGYKYLLRTIAAADGDRSLSTPLTRYYTEEGTPPGNWMGSALPGLGDGQIGAGDQVSEAQLQLLIGMGRDPITGKPLGRAFPRYVSVADRISERVKGLDPGLGMGERAEQVAQIEAEETERGNRRAVAGFDYTFSVPKSVSVLWGVADAGTQALIAQTLLATVGGRSVAPRYCLGSSPRGIIIRLPLISGIFFVICISASVIADAEVVDDLAELEVDQVVVGEPGQLFPVGALQCRQSGL